MLRQAAALSFEEEEEAEDSLVDLLSFVSEPEDFVSSVLLLLVSLVPFFP
jgi:hypothetical protein